MTKKSLKLALHIIYFIAKHDLSKFIILIATIMKLNKHDLPKYIISKPSAECTYTYCMQP